LLLKTRKDRALSRGMSSLKRRQPLARSTAPILGIVLLICFAMTTSVGHSPLSIGPWSTGVVEYWSTGRANVRSILLHYSITPRLHHSIVFVLSPVSCFLSFTVYYLLFTAYWFQTHRVVTVFSSMNIFMEASLDLAVPTKDSLLDPRGKNA